jgi:uncharacterized membrane protein YdbT with pleckstrin-like domain
MKNDKENRMPFVCPAFLLPKERVIFETNPHWLFVAVPESALAVLGVLILEYLPFLTPEWIPGSRWLPSVVGAAWSFAMAVIFLDWLCTKYYLTNLRLIEERGIIGKRIMNIRLDRVQDVTCRFGIFGKIFDFGNIEIESAGTHGKIVFGFLPSPQRFLEEIEKAIGDFHHYTTVQ